jgi:hypothetical protein
LNKGIEVKKKVAVEEEGKKSSVNKIYVKNTYGKQIFWQNVVAMNKERTNERKKKWKNFFSLSLSLSFS